MEISKFSNDTKCYGWILGSWEDLFNSMYGIYTLLGIDSLVVYKFLNTHFLVSPNYNILVFNLPPTLDKLVLPQALKAWGVHGPKFKWSWSGEGWGYIVNYQKINKKLQELSH